jgi:pectinesterase
MKRLLYTAFFLLFSLTLCAQNYKYEFTVAKDGSAEYTTIQDAINAMRVFPLKRITLRIKNGIYNEKIELPSSNTEVTFIGESVDKTIITFNDYSGRGKTNTFTSYTAKIAGNDFRAENITFINSAGPVGQAVALHLESDRAVFKNCRFIGCQDTMYLAGENCRQLFIDCYVEGTTDFIFGPSTAIFQNCTIKSKANSYITAANTPEGIPYGFVFLNCNLIADSAATKVYLGRPWRIYAKTVFIGCKMESHILPEGWENWQKPEAEKTAFYAEYGNSGAGYVPGSRVNWSRQLTAKEAKLYTAEKIFNSQKAISEKERAWYKY